MADDPLISVGMSVRNSATTLALALRSVQRQSCVDWELILIDDGSTDATLEVARSFAADQRIHLLPKTRSRGLAHRLNQAVDLARGRYFARMDGDDVCFPDRFARQAAYLDHHPEIDLLGSGGVVFSGDGHPLGVRPAPTSHEEICRHPWSGFYLAHPSWMGRIEWFRGHRYDERAIKAQDYDLLLRSYRDSRFAALPELLIGYREERLDLRKSMATRRQVVAAQWRYARASKSWSALPAAVCGQLAKGAFEMMALGSGATRRLLGHRAGPIDTLALQAWESLWGMLKREEGKSPCVE